MNEFVLQDALIIRIWLCRKSGKTLVVKIDAQGVKRCDQDVHSHVKFFAIDQQRFVNVN